MDKALETAETLVEGLAPFAQKNYPIIGLEPSEILTIRDEYLDLVPDAQLQAAKTLASKTYTFEEFVTLHKDRFPNTRLNPTSKAPKVVLHGHCHTKALIGNTATIKALELAGSDVDAMDTGCCGMAGSFGYDQETYELSMEIGWQRLFPQLGNLLETQICASGFSCSIKWERNRDGCFTSGYSYCSANKSSVVLNRNSYRLRAANTLCSCLTLLVMGNQLFS